VDLLEKRRIQMGTRGSFTGATYWTVAEYEDARSIKWSQPGPRNKARPRMVPVQDLTAEPAMYLARVVDQEAWEAQMRHMLGLD
jgi:hypothetical protein